jgi:Bacterial mobilisation protein (MobC)
MKEDNRNYPTTIKWTQEELIQIQIRSNALGMTRVEYLRERGLEPIEEFQKTREQKSRVQSEVATYIAILRELNRQGINLNQITKAINSGKLEGKSVEQCLQSIDKIRSINQRILESIADPGGDL